jgi:hypothetical protein
LESYKQYQMLEKKAHLISEGIMPLLANLDKFMFSVEASGEDGGFLHLGFSNAPYLAYCIDF